MTSKSISLYLDSVANNTTLWCKWLTIEGEESKQNYFEEKFVESSQIQFAFSSELNFLDVLANLEWRIQSSQFFVIAESIRCCVNVSEWNLYAKKRFNFALLVCHGEWRKLGNQDQDRMWIPTWDQMFVSTENQ